jgi:hypothetical protein
MTSGGARARSGPPADPNALRRDRADDKAWVTLPVEPVEEVPTFPLSKLLVYDVYFADKVRVKEINENSTEARWEAELELWADLWSKPQAHMWVSLALKWQVAAYVRAYIESVGPDSNAGLKTAVLRMEAELGLSTVGMGQLRWKFAADELAERRDEPDEPARSSARDRMKALNA